jgi:NAD(P)-dependent dehydrogenase (short-subunit alcohol dehydrogenase family)
VARVSDLGGRPAIVTGAARGIGAAYARALIEAGAAVVVSDVLEEEGERLASELGGEAVFVAADVADEAAVAELVRRAEERFGPVEILVNNAGVYQDLERKRAFWEITAEEWDRVMAVNARGPWACAKAVVPSMRRRGRGRIVNVASATVHTGVPGFAHYVASKGAVIGLTRVLARELGAFGITVNAIAPGLVANEASERVSGTDYIAASAAQRAIARPMDAADLVGTLLFLASPASDFMTGQTLVVDGGKAFS